MKVFPVAVALVLLAVGFAAADGFRPAAQDPVAPSGAAPEAAPVPTVQHLVQRKAKVAVAFKLDPELTRGMFLGERWVSPPSFLFAQPGLQYIAQGKAQYVDAAGERADVPADWATSVPDMIALTPHASGDATIVVRNPGDGEFTVATRYGTKRVQVHARQVGDGMQVDFRQ
ncbi:MAG: hypothetical protein ACJ8GK_11635 [Luteimonas sp.]